MSDERHGVVKVIPIERIDDSIPLALGEYFYQLRAALDTLLWKAYEAAGGTVNESQLYFPIFDKASSFKSGTFHGVNLPDKLKIWLRAIQPCFASECAPDSDEAAISNALSIINKCAKSVRHRHLHLAGVYVTASTVGIEVTPPALVIANEFVAGNFFDSQLVVANFEIKNGQSDTQIRINSSFTVELSIKEIPPEVGAEVESQLRHLSTVVRIAIQTFEDFSCFRPAG